MSAHWPVTKGQPLQPEPIGAPLHGLGLGMLLRATAARHPERIALIDPADKPAWSGRPAITWTYAAAAEIVERLASGLRDWRLPPGSRIGLCLPGSAESALALLAVEAAGHVACLLPVAWDVDRLVAATQGAGIAAVLTQTRLGSVALAERFCTVAVHYFGLRYLAAFGPDVPDGVVNLDALALERREPALSEAGSGGLVSFADSDPDQPFHREGAALVAAAAAHLVAMRARPNERILSLVGPHDLRGLATGLGAALVSGASLETLPLFDGTGFAATLAKAVPTHLVAPGFLENNLAGRALPESVRSVSFLHRAPVRFPCRARTGGAQAPQVAAIIDAVAFGERAILSGRRGTADDVALVLARPDALGLPGALMAMRREPDGQLAFTGRACAAAPLQRGIPATMPDDSWQSTDFHAVLSAGIAIGLVSEAGTSSGAAPDSFAIA